MLSSEPFLPFSNNLLSKRIRFDDKLDLVREIIPIDQKTCLFIDSSYNFHLKTFLKEDKKSASLQFPLPPYARNINPRVVYSVDYFDLYTYLYEKKPSVNLQERGARYMYTKFCYLGDYQLAVQLDRSNHVMILDLHKPQDLPVILEEVYGVECLISVGNGCLAWYERSVNSVILYHYISRKRKILNFAKLEIQQLKSLKDHVIVAIAANSLEILDYVRNKIIKSACFFDGCAYDDIPAFAIHSEGNMISYMYEEYIYVLKTEEGKIEWERRYESKNYDEESSYVFITNNLIALNNFDGIHILLLDSQNFSLHSKIESPLIGFSETLNLEARCCENIFEKSFMERIFPLGENSFGILEILCGTQYKIHGHQRLTQFSLKDLKTEDASNQHPGVDSIKFQLHKSILFEEFRDSVRAIDVLDENLAMFITERGRIFQVNLNNHSVEFITELTEIVKQKKEKRIRQIDKFFALAENKVAISTKTASSRSARIAVISLKTRKAEWKSDYMRDGEDSDSGEEDEWTFYDMVKSSSNEILVSYRDYDEDDDNESLYQIGKLCPEYGGRYDFSEYEMQQRDDVIFDRLWSLEDSHLVAMGHGQKRFCLSFLNTIERRIEKEFDAAKLFPSGISGQTGIYDVKSVSRNILGISVTTSYFPSSYILLYNIQTEELLCKISTYEHTMIGRIKQCYRENDILQTMRKMAVFGSRQPYGIGFESKPLHNIIDKKTGLMSFSGVYDWGQRVSSKNWKLLSRGDQALICENSHHRNFVCILKSPNFKVECIKILRKAVRNAYHKYLYKDVIDMIFGVQQ